MARGATWALGVNILTVGLGAIVQFTLARVLGSGGYGQYLYVLGWMNICLIFVKFDFDLSSVRYVATYSGSGQSALLRGFERTALGFTSSLSLGVGTVGAVTLWLLRDQIGESLARSGILAAAALPVMTIAAVMAGALRGRKLIPQATAHLIVRPLLLLICVVILVVAGKSISTELALAINVGAALVAATLTAWLLARARRGMATDRIERRRREWFATAAGMMPAAIAEMTLGHTIDVVIVGTLLGSVQAGVYGLASQLLAPSTFVMAAIVSIGAPMIADLYANGRKEDLKRLIRVMGRVNILFIVPALALLWLVAPFVLPWFGEGYRSGYPVMVILGIGNLSASLGSFAAVMLTMTGHHKDASVIIGVSAVTNLVLALILTPLFGLVGIATATTVALFVRNISLVVVAKRRTGVNPVPI
jgi:O-antigen/teichoic acid export membrane protein